MSDGKLMFEGRKDNGRRNIDGFVSDLMVGWCRPSRLDGNVGGRDNTSNNYQDDEWQQETT